MITLILPYYRASAMLAAQLEEIAQYPANMRVIVVDDGSPEPAEDYIIKDDKVSLYRINVDVPWNREQARNLGAYVADTKWIIQADIDHILPATYAKDLLGLPLNDKHWYRFNRYRVGKADATRRKDAIPEDQEYGKIHPHVDSYLITRDMYLSSPYDERYSGCLGGGTPFTSRMTRLYGAPPVLPYIALHVYTRDKVKDASISTLSRDTTEYTRRRAAIGTDDKPRRMLLHPWHRVL